MTTWTAPKTWLTGEALTAEDMNTHIRNNLLALKAPPTNLHTCDESADYTTTSTSFVNVDGTNLSLTIETTGGDVLIGFFGTVNNGSGNTFFDVEMDGERLAGDDGMIRVLTNGGGMAASFVFLKAALSAGSHTFKLQWKVGSGTSTLYAGAGTSSSDLHPQFWVREI